jgi:hypothetical protein
VCADLQVEAAPLVKTQLQAPVMVQAGATTDDVLRSQKMGSLIQVGFRG